MNVNLSFITFDYCVISVRRMTALMFFYLRKDLAINTRINFQDMGAGQHRLT
jgi:hypothetical protein